MPAQALFWLLAIGLVLGTLAVVLAPLRGGAGRGERRARYDMAVHRDQLREIDGDRARGLLSDDEAAATRAEIGRRLLAAAAAAEAEADRGLAPRWLSRRAAPALLAGGAVAAAAIYAAIGSPDLPDQPLALRLQQQAAVRADRPGQAEAEARVGAQAAPATTGPDGSDAALVARLQAALKDRPDDLEGHRLLARSLVALQRWPEAEAAQGAVVGLLGDRAAAADLVAWAELMIRAADGYVSPEAEAALHRALALQPGNPLGRYYSGLILLQGGRPDLAYRMWSRLLAEGPGDAPWMAPLREVIGAVAAEAGLPPDAAPGPGDVDAAARMSPDESQAVVAGMVDGLAARLGRDGGPAEDWARLIRSLGVLGRTGEAQQAWTRAQAAHGDAAGLATLAAAARDAGLTP